MLRQAPLAATERGRRLFVPPAGFNDLVAYAAHGYNVLVLADRGGGKTSSLRQLQLMLDERARPDEPVVAFADLSTAANVHDALALIIEAARTANHVPPTLELPLTGAGPGNRVDSLLRGLGMIPPTRLLLDNVDPAAAGYPLFGGLRDRLWEQHHHFVVAADAADRSAFLRPPADAFWEQVVELGMTETQALEMVRRRLDGEEDWTEALVGAVGPNPRRLIAAAQRIEAGNQSPEAVAAEYKRRSARLEERSAMARRLYRELEDLGPTSPSDERLLRRLAVSRPAIDRALRELQDAGLARSYFRADGPGRPRRIYELEQ